MSITLHAVFASLQSDPDGWYTLRIDEKNRQEIENALARSSCADIVHGSELLKTFSNGLAQGREAALEEAAQQCDTQANGWHLSEEIGKRAAVTGCSRLIRALKAALPECAAITHADVVADYNAGMGKPVAPSEGPTPRTDALDRGEDAVVGLHEVPALIDGLFALARQLERELAEATNRLKATEAHTDELETEKASVSANPPATAEAHLMARGVFKGMEGLRGLANNDAFWEKQPYGTRLYYGDGGLQYLHRSVLQSAVEALDNAPLSSTAPAMRNQYLPLTDVYRAIQDLDRDQLLDWIEEKRVSTPLSASTDISKE